MKSAFRNTYVLTAVFLFSLKSFSQDPFFLNSQQSLNELNPAFAGSNGLLRVQSNYQINGPHIYNNGGSLKTGSAYITNYSSVDAYIKPINGGFSFSYMHDNQADKTLQTSFYNLAYAHHFLLVDQKLKLIPSLMASFADSRIDWRNISFSELNNIRNNYRWNTWERTPSGSRRYFDLAIGGLFSFEHLYIGGSVFHIFQPDIAFAGDYKIPTRFVLHGSYNLHLPFGNLIYVYGRYERQASYTYSQLGAKAVLLRHIIVGAGYINGNTPDVLFGLRGNFISLQLDYGYNSSAGAFDRASILQLSLSVNVRPKIRFRELTDFESW